MWGILSVLHRGWGCGVFCQSYIGVGMWGILSVLCRGGDMGYFVSLT